ncbi:MAG: hypothetical protein ABIR54_14595 [Burkholderiaceae bacterium]|jgi:hypothetical protein
MKPIPEKQKSPSHPIHPPVADSDKLAKAKAEEREVAGRHKNDGQKDHKGAR